MPTKTTPKKTTTPKRRALENDGKPKGKGKGGKVTVHGVTTTGYQRGCRCDECRAAATEAKRRARDRKRQAAETEAAAKSERSAKAKARRAARKGTTDAAATVTGRQRAKRVDAKSLDWPLMTREDLGAMLSESRDDRAGRRRSGREVDELLGSLVVHSFFSSSTRSSLSRSSPCGGTPSPSAALTPGGSTLSSWPPFGFSWS